MTENRRSKSLRHFFKTGEHHSVRMRKKHGYDDPYKWHRYWEWRNKIERNDMTTKDGLKIKEFKDPWEIEDADKK